MGKSETDLYKEETDEYGNPHIVTLTCVYLSYFHKYFIENNEWISYFRSRSVAVQEAILKVAAFLFPDQVNPPGMISFHPGKAEVGRARANLIPTDIFLELTRTDPPKAESFK